MGSKRPKGAFEMFKIQNRRGNVVPERVVFRESLPLALKNNVKNKSQKSGEKVCMEEMMSLMDCMGKYNQDKTMCVKELAGFEKCFAQAKITMESEQLKKGLMPVGPRARVSSEQLNKYLKKFPQSGRTTQDYIDSKWKE